MTEWWAPAGQWPAWFMAAWLASISWQIAENLVYRKEIASVEPKLRRRLLGLAWERSILILLFSGAFLMCASHLLLMKPPKPVVEQCKPLPAPVCPKPAPPVPAPVELIPEKSELEKIFNSSSPDEKALAKLDELKRRYENLLVNYQLLARCNQAQEADYHLLSSALLRELASMGGPGRLQYDIETAAKGSYREIYSAIPCTSPDIAKQAQEFAAYINSLKAQKPLQNP